MKLFRIFKKKPRLLGHGQAGDGPIPTATSVDVPASDVPATSDIPAVSSTPDTSSAGGVPAAGDVPTASDVPAANSTPDTSSHPIGAEILVQGVDPITAE